MSVDDGCVWITVYLLGLIMIPLGLVDGTCGCPPSFLVLDLGLVASLSRTVGGDGLLLGRWTEEDDQPGGCGDLGSLWDATWGYWIVGSCHRTLDNIGRCRPPQIYLEVPNVCEMVGVNVDVRHRSYCSDPKQRVDSISGKGRIES